MVFLTDFLDGKGEILIKYTFFLEAHRSWSESENESVLVDQSRRAPVIEETPFTIKLSHVPPQRFRTNLQMEQCDESRLSAHRSGGKKIIRIRNLIFIDCQVYAIGEGHVLRMVDPNGFLALKLSDKEFRSIHKQLRRRLDRGVKVTSE